MNELIDRWKSERGIRIAEAFLSPLRDRSEGWGRLESGLLDFRGLDLGSRSAPGKPRCIVRGTIRKVDLSFSNLFSVVFEGDEFSGKMEKAVFREGAFRGARVIGVSFDDSDLRGAVLSSPDFATGRIGTPEGCSFRRTDLRKVDACNGRITDCDFTNARLNGTWFNGTVFTRCKFAGPLKNVVFDATPLKSIDESNEEFERRYATNPGALVDCDFSEAIFTDVEFRRLPLDSVKLPDPAKHVFIHNWQCVMPRALEIASQDGDPGLGFAARLKVFLEWAHPRMPVAIISPRSYPNTGSDSWPYVQSVLQRAEAWCRERRQ